MRVRGAIVASRCGSRWLSSTTSAPERQDAEIKPLSEMPGPKGLPIVGTSFEMMRNAKRFFDRVNEQHRKYGHIYKESFGGYTTVYLSDPDVIRDFYRLEIQNPTRPPLIPWLHWKNENGKRIGLFLS